MGLPLISHHVLTLKTFWSSPLPPQPQLSHPTNPFFRQRKLAAFCSLAQGPTDTLIEALVPLLLLDFPGPLKAYQSPNDPRS